MKELISIQANLKAPKNQFNGFGKYNYRSCEDILEGLKPHLLENKCILTLTDDAVELGGVLMIKATATITNADDKSVTVHAFAGIDPSKRGMDISQTFGSSSSYARKYALNGLFCIDDTKDADTQNNDEKDAATPKQAPKKANTGARPNTKTKLGTNTAGYSKAFTAYRDAESKFKRDSIKDSILNAYADANDVLNKLDEDYGKYLSNRSFNL